MGLLLRRRNILAKIIEKIAKVTLPVGYTQVEYIESTGTQYINTEFNPTGNTRIKTNFYMPADITVANMFFSNRHQINDSSFFMIKTNSEIFFRYNNKSYNIPISKLYNNNSCYWQLDTQKENIEDDNSFNIEILDDQNSVLYTSNYYSKDDFSSTNPLLLFLDRYIDASNEEKNTFGQVKLFSFKIYENNELVRDFIPCYKTEEDGIETIGLYDLVNDKFYSNAGTGTFLKGADIL